MDIDTVMNNLLVTSKSKLERKREKAGIYVTNNNQLRLDCQKRKSKKTLKAEREEDGCSLVQIHLENVHGTNPFPPP